MGKLGMPIKTEGFKKHLGLQAQTVRVGGFPFLTAPRTSAKECLLGGTGQRPQGSYWCETRDSGGH